MTFVQVVAPSPQATRAVLIFAAAVATLLVVWIFQWMGYQPCELCLTERIAFYVGAPLAALTALLAGRNAHRLAQAGFVLLALAFLANAILAFYHVGVEYHWWAGPTACTGALGGSVDVNGMMKELNSVRVARCDEAQLRIFGLSLAAWDVVASAALAIFAATAARLER